MCYQQFGSLASVIVLGGFHLLSETKSKSGLNISGHYTKLGTGMFTKYSLTFITHHSVILVLHLRNCTHLSGRVQDQECMWHPGTCGAPMYLQGVTQGEWVPAECLSRSVIMYKSYTQGGLYLSRSEKKATFSFYLSLTIYNGQVMWRKELNKKAVTHY